MMGCLFIFQLYVNPMCPHSHARFNFLTSLLESGCLDTHPGDISITWSCNLLVFTKSTGFATVSYHLLSFARFTSRKLVAKNPTIKRERWRRVSGSSQQFPVCASLEERSHRDLHHSVQHQGAWQPAHHGPHDPSTTDQAPCR